MAEKKHKFWFDCELVELRSTQLIEVFPNWVKDPSPPRRQPRSDENAIAVVKFISD